MKITAYQLAKQKLLFGLNGKPLVNKDYVRLFIQSGVFKTYKFEPSKFSPRGSHTVELEEVEQWNKQFIQLT